MTAHSILQMYPQTSPFTGTNPFGEGKMTHGFGITFWPALKSEHFVLNKIKLAWLTDLLTDTARVTQLLAYFSPFKSTKLEGGRSLGTSNQLVT